MITTIRLLPTTRRARSASLAFVAAFLLSVPASHADAQRATACDSTVAASVVASVVGRARAPAGATLQPHALAPACTGDARRLPAALGASALGASALGASARDGRWRSVRHDAWRGFAWGALAGAAAGAVWCTADDECGDEGGKGSAAFETAVFSGVTGAVLGLGIGAIVGAMRGRA